MNNIVFSARADALITGNSEMAGRIRSYDWAKTPLGRIEDWSETLLATANLMLHSPFPTILSWGPEMVFLYNDAAIPTLTVKHPTALGGFYRDVFHEAWDLVGADLEACFYRGETAVRDNMFIPILLNGVLEDHYWSYSLIPVYENGRIGGVYDAFRNMTSTVVGAQRLRQSETRLKLATEVAKLGVFVWDTVQDKGSWENDRMYEIFGRSPGEDAGSGVEFLRDIVHPDYRDSFHQAVERTVRDGDPFQFEGLIYLPDKTIRCIEVKGNLQTESEASVGRILGTTRDVTEIRRTEEALRNSARHLAQLAAIVESSDDVIVSKTLDGIITSWNAAATRVFGYTADEMIGQSILKLIPENFHSDEKLIIENIRAGKRIEHFDTVRITKDGRLIDVSLTVSPIRDADGRIIGASKILRDISVRKRMEQSLLQAEKIAATGRMAATMAHEINNPLEAVGNLIYIAKANPNAPPEIVRSLSIAEQELERVAHITRQTLGFYRESNEAEQIDIPALIESVFRLYSNKLNSKNIRVERKFCSCPPTLGVPGELKQVISNLVSNAIDAVAPNGKIFLRLQSVEDSNGGRIQIVIEDNGPGIPTEHLDRIFEPFFTTKKDVGTGLGLWITKEIIERHGGTITVSSPNGNGPATGAAFVIDLPCHPDREPKPPLVQPI
jgi:PAS domain S-box-containing protein